MAPQRRLRGKVAAVAMAAACLVPAFSQTTPGTPSTGGSAPRPTIPSTPTNTNGTSPTAPTNQNTMPQYMRVSGRVVMDDGSPLSFPATIERVCSGNPHAEGYTDSKGYFSLVLGQNTDVIADASEVQSGRVSGGGPGTVTPSSGSGLGLPNSGRSINSDNRFSSCDLRASLGGYTSQVLNLTGRTAMDNPDVGNIVLHRMGSSETATTVTATTLKASKEARRAMQKGMDLAKKGKPDEAMASLQEAVQLYSDFAFAWCELGKLQLQTDHIPDAHESFTAAAKAEPRWPEPLLHLAVMGVKAHDWREVAETTDRVLHLNTFEYPQAYFLNGAANFNLHNLDVAEKDALNAEKLDIEHLYPQVQRLLGIIYTERHRYAEAAEKFRAYLMLAPNAEDVPVTRQDLASAERMAAQSARIAAKEQQQQ